MKKAAIIIAGFLLLGCDKQIGKSTPSYREYMMDSYITLDNLVVSNTRLSWGSFYLDFTGKEYSLTSSDPAERAEFLRIAENYGGRVDRKLIWFPWILHVGYAEDLFSIDIRSDQALDAEHPAGSLLNDVFGLFYCSYAPYLRNENGNVGVKEIFRHSVADLKPGDVSAIIREYSGGSLNMGLDRINRTYDRTIRHTLTFTITTQSGRVLTSTFVLEPEL